MKIKGILFEFIIRQLLLDRGFTSVIPDKHYVYEDRGLFFINGKGAAHDADVLMDPPMQIPFSYPSRVLFECKAYRKTRKVGLNIIRNALGLRYDINEFEIVNDQMIKDRKTKSRYASSNRNRYQYQVGVASVNYFSKNAREFAANNKIPLLSLRNLMPGSICDLFDEIDGNYLGKIAPRIIEELQGYLKSKSKDTPISKALQNFLNTDSIIGKIHKETKRISNVLVALNEYSDFFFLFGDQIEELENLKEKTMILKGNIVKGRLPSNKANFLDETGKDDSIWSLVIKGNMIHFFFTDEGMQQWENSCRVHSDLKHDNIAKQSNSNFSGTKIYVFGLPEIERNIPFRIIEVDTPWVGRIIHIGHNSLNS